MRPTFRSCTVCCLVVLGTLALIPSPALASFGKENLDKLIVEVLLFFASIAGMALILGATSTAVLVWAIGRKWAWFLTPIFAVCWFAVIVGIFNLWQMSQTPY